MIPENFKKWFVEQSEEEKHKLIKNKSIDVNRTYKRMVNAINKELENGFNRVGIRGGKQTSLNANTQKITETYLYLLEQLKYMVSVL